MLWVKFRDATKARYYRYIDMKQTGKAVNFLCLQHPLLAGHMLEPNYCGVCLELSPKLFLHSCSTCSALLVL